MSVGQEMKHDSRWRQLVFAFYGLAHNDPKLFEALPDDLKATEAGRLCQAVIDAGNLDGIHAIGVLLTGSQQWYTYIGRM